MPATRIRNARRRRACVSEAANGPSVSCMRLFRQLEEHVLESPGILRDAVRVEAALGERPVDLVRRNTVDKQLVVVGDNGPPTLLQSAGGLVPAVDRDADATGAAGKAGQGALVHHPSLADDGDLVAQL